ncbi:hypothetical protein SERLA73DRAFT_185182 [Serpula lacrymans var. lacrymans S7.3]|uniref:Uncharacterized protein n=2 Tax=Serpula lacrymans var. lacrymans TaxID=341189 RepID=F8Q480_SERL3|nr:uncharacterized protein SERLADRAFT_440548 [Serpula lacrymans var. lacrymans S7.9]EGN96936.1 hypothetical protein SERLA73DRAFT_185182 [Serpula lacrymans var. lacrymans S7.3]EGO22529.1 hypothetical protein SERLADRAFT_440548 [Serpula lacrymans var. lacrymans S7.9]
MSGAILAFRSRSALNLPLADLWALGAIVYKPTVSSDLSVLLLHVDEALKTDASHPLSSCHRQKDVCERYAKQTYLHHEGVLSHRRRDSFQDSGGSRNAADLAIIKDDDNRPGLADRSGQTSPVSDQRSV